MMRLVRMITAAGITAGVLTATPAAADQWNDKTTLTFSAPVMVPGTTLPAGAYEFRLLNSLANRHVVQIRRESDGKVLATTQAVPTKRPEPRGDVVVKFNPTESGAAPALKSWFYPGTVYGHQFIYSGEQAKAIAQRTKTLVLSMDEPGTDAEQGILYTYDASGVRSAWRGDEATTREWDQWLRDRNAQPARSADADERREATAPMMQADFAATRVRLDDLEDDPAKYMGKTISVDAEVEDVHGPRLFTIDEPNWADLQGEMLVHVPSPLAALVRENDRVTITGTVKPFVRAEVERNWGWLDLDSDTEVELQQKPVLVASRIVGGDDNRVLVISSDDSGTMRNDDSGKAAAPRPGMKAVSDPAVVGRADEESVGQHVALNVPVHTKARDRGFFVTTGDTEVFVLPAFTQIGIARTGEPVSIEGVVLQMPRAMRDRLDSPRSANDDIYIYATHVSRHSS